MMRVLQVIGVLDRGVAETMTMNLYLPLIHISEPTNQPETSFAIFCWKKKIMN